MALAINNSAISLNRLICSNKVNHIFRASSRLFSNETESKKQVEAKSDRRPFYKKIWSGTSNKEEKNRTKESEADREYALHVEETRKFEEEELKRNVFLKRNKSMLSASDRRILYREPPNVGFKFEYFTGHQSREFKMRLMGEYGIERTGLDPSLAWPTPNDIERQKEYEKVLYDGQNLIERIAQNKLQKEEKRRQMKLREEEIDRNFAKMGNLIEKMESRNVKRREASKIELGKREKMLAELRQEYGYDIDPTNIAFADRIAEKEKEIQKREKELKKQKRLQEMQDKLLAQAAEEKQKAENSNESNKPPETSS